MISKGILKIEAGSGGDGDEVHQDGDTKPHQSRAGIFAVTDRGTTGAAVGGSGSGGGGSNNGGSTG